MRSNIGRTVTYKDKTGGWSTGTVTREFKRYGTLEVEVNGTKGVIGIPLPGNPNSRFVEEN